MKKILSAFLLVTLIVSAKAQTTCATAVDFLSPDSCITGNVLSSAEMWFEFTADSAQTSVAAYRSGGTTYIRKIEVYSGTCGSLVFKDSSLGSTDSTVFINLSGLVASTKYYIKAVRYNTGTANFDICLNNQFKAPIPCAAPTACGLVSNGGFESSTAGYSGHFNPFPLGKVTCWRHTHGSPQVFNSGGNTGSWYTLLSSNAGTFTGDGIYTDVNVVAGHTYVLDFYIKKVTPAGTGSTVDNLYIKLGASTSFAALPSAGIPNPGSQQTAGHVTAFTNTGWTHYSFCYSANANYDRLFIYPESNSSNGSNQYLVLDDVQLTELTVNAGSDLAFSSCPSSGNLGSSTCAPIPGVTYSWLPVAGLSDPASPNPVINPVSSNQTYTVTASVGACSVTDAVNVTNSGSCSGSYVMLCLPRQQAQLHLISLTVRSLIRTQLQLKWNRTPTA
jgi:hypothetical protein